MQSCPLHRTRFGQLNACFISCGGMTGEMGTCTEGKEIAGLTAIVTNFCDVKTAFFFTCKYIETLKTVSAKNDDL